ncbi:MAG: FAD-dependent oxidoreductase, partial [Lachnospiraceae bacterium]|nr:FAD-dependent oxidoreductase [Lachnospiraceae bacterium]
GILPDALNRVIIEAMTQFGRKIRGFDGADALFAGVESRTSSPVRITRGEDGQADGVRGLYPCGEGAGYAGGIMSAAMDGIRTARKIQAAYAPGEMS